MHAPVDRSPLHRHPQPHSQDPARVAAQLRGKDFELPRLRSDATGAGVRMNAIDLPNILISYVKDSTEAVVTTKGYRALFGERPSDTLRWK